MAIIALPTLPTLQMMRLRLRRQLAFFLPPHHAGPSTFECRHDRRNLLPSWTQRAPHSPHLASHAFLEMHSKLKFPRRWAAGHGRSTIRGFPHPIRLAAFVSQAHRNSRPRNLVQRASKWVGSSTPVKYSGGNLPAAFSRILSSIRAK